MLIYEKQGVVCVDGLVLGRSKFHFGNEFNDKAWGGSRREPHPFIYSGFARILGRRNSWSLLLSSAPAFSICRPMQSWPVARTTRAGKCRGWAPGLSSSTI